MRDWCGRHEAHRRDLPRCWAAAGPGRVPRQRIEPHTSAPAPLVWRAPEGPEGTGGLRGAATNEVRPPSLAGGRAIRRPEHQRGHKQTSRKTTNQEGPEGQAAADVGGGGAWPGFEPTRRAKLAARTARGRAAAHGRTKQPGPNRPHGARNTSGATSTARTPARHSKRGRH